MRALLSALLFVASAVLTVGCQAEEKYQAEKHYFVLPQPVPTSDPNKIEVTEVFWYGCVHCYHYSPNVKEWSEKLPEDVVFVRNPSTLGRKQFEVHTRAYYTAKSMNKLDVMHAKLFDAYHKEHKRMTTEREIGDVFEQEGVDREQFRSVFNSFGVISQSMQAQSRNRAYRITGTPSIVVNGKYRIGVESAGSTDAMLEVADFLIEKERNAKK